MDERQFFTEKPEQRPARFQCPRCRRTNDYSIRWMRRTKKAQVPGGADARDRAMFEKVKDHLVRVDDDVTCKTCGKRFEIPPTARWCSSKSSKDCRRKTSSRTRRGSSRDLRSA